MEFDGSGNDVKPNIQFDGINNACDLEVLQEPPDCSLSLKEFEDYAVARLKLLRTLERVCVTSEKGTSKMQLRKSLEKELNELGLHHFAMLLVLAITSDNNNLDDKLRAVKFDHISHHILRLAFCRTEEMRRWFVAHEVEFFRWKLFGLYLDNIPKDYLAKHFGDSVIKYEPTPEELIDLADVYFDFDHVVQSDYYQVPFTLCLEYVRTRQVYLRHGQAIIHNKHMVGILCADYRKKLSKDLALINKTISIIDEDERLFDVLKDFDKRYTGSSYVPNSEATAGMTVEKLENVFEKSFPLCMKGLYDTVKRESHLKHFGRLQLGLFLKGVGLPMEEATRFWRTHFTRKPGLDSAKFDKQYLYGIRHMYGKEGKKADYTPYSCMKIIQSNVAPGESHGCPFRHDEKNSLMGKLNAAKVTPQGIKEIMEFVERKHYTFACQRYFEYTHDKATVNNGITHPNQYFKSSEDVLSGNFKIKTEVDPMKPTKTTKLYPKKENVNDMNREEIEKCFNVESEVVQTDLNGSIESEDTATGVD